MYLMFKLNEIRDLIKLMDQTSIQTIEIENENGKLVIKKPEVNEPPVAVAPPAAVMAPPVMPVSQIALTPQMPVQPVQGVPAQVAPAGSFVEQSVAAPAPTDADANLHKIVSPMVGTFYRKPAPEKPAYVEVGERVQPDKVVCIVEAMKLMNEIVAEVSGEVVKILVEDGQLVEYGQPLFLVKSDT